MFIKFGQLLSTRTDVVPVKITSHLKELTDQCKPFATNDAKKIIVLVLNLAIVRKKDFHFGLEERLLSQLVELWPLIIIVWMDLFQEVSLLKHY